MSGTKTKLTLPPEYTEVHRPNASVTYEIRATPPDSNEDEGMAIVSKEKDGTFCVEYWPDGASNWRCYAVVSDLEEAKEMCKAIVLMGLSVFLPRETKDGY